ncbi:MAG: hypothetical protein IJ867_07940 [Clostridia bacterium]|nr:hypothetical protein [Clostridia bacterium]
MKDKNEKAKRLDGATTRLSSEEVNRKAKNKKTNDMSETQMVDASAVKAGGKRNKKNKKGKDGKKKKLKFRERHPRIATIIRIILLLILLAIIIFAGIIFGALWGGFNFFDLLSDDYKIDLESLVIKSENSYIYDAERK